jgi:hypothetical protein
MDAGPQALHAPYPAMMDVIGNGDFELVTDIKRDLGSLGREGAPLAQ